MNQTAAENFINSLVRNLQVLCHSNVEFRNDIEVVGHLYLKVDRQKKFNYIVDEKVCKNDASSTVFMSNSYHSENQSKKNLENENREYQKDTVHQSNSENSNANFRSKSNDKKRSLQNSEAEPVKKKTAVHHENSNNRRRSTPQIPQTSSNIKAEPIVDLSLIKREPSIDEDDNLPCFFPSQISQHSSSSSPTKESNFHDTGQNMDNHSIHLFQSSQSAVLPHLQSPAISSQSVYHSTTANNALPNPNPQSSSNLTNPQLLALLGPIRQRSTYTTDDKIHAVELAKKEGIQKVSEMLNIPASTIYMWRKAFQK